MRVFKWFWNLLFKSRSLEWRTAKVARFSIEWGPYIGFDFDFHIQFTPGYTIEFEPGDAGTADEPYSYGPDFRAGIAVGWITLDFTMPNNDHPDDDVAMPTLYCPKCGLETESVWCVQRCTGCRELAVVCTCVKRDCCVDSGTADAAACCRGE